eukprot:CAMPEP_0196141112 /NCGR_PEP_ID=MMETSP0910-20130528/8779_1 /TAXON_ID=49265 /ORGANISM="Thalassiosira rotula, Strain GSO102" /LENGTH=68 /DNA_ID=CAMNT_0041402153 /DNA_START=1104 /DNA_END=1310 /DNA_ORIENTATION=+
MYSAQGPNEFANEEMDFIIVPAAEEGTTADLDAEDDSFLEGMGFSARDDHRGKPGVSYVGSSIFRITI